jgi:hypothetical protein
VDAFTMSASYLDTPATFLDKLKGVALSAAFIGVLIIFAMWVSLWEKVWQASVEPIRRRGGSSKRVVG